MEKKSKYQAQMNYAKRQGLVKIGFDDKKEVRDEFKTVCEAQNKAYSRVLKDYVHDYINLRKNGLKCAFCNEIIMDNDKYLTIELDQLYYVHEICRKEFLKNEDEKLKAYKKQSIPLYKIVDKIEELEFSEELQNEYDKLNGCEAVIQGYKELLRENKVKGSMKDE